MFERIHNKSLGCLVISHTLFIEWESVAFKLSIGRLVPVH